MKDNSTLHRAGELAKRLDVHPNTIRSWSDDFESLLSQGAIGRAPGAKRRFTDDDALILATIADMRNDGIGFDDIRAAIENGKRVDVLPALPTEAEEEARQNVKLVPLPEYQRALDEVKRLAAQVDDLRVERDLAMAKRQEGVAELNEQIRTLERDLGTAQGQLRTVRYAVIAVAVTAVAVLIVAVAVIVAVSGGV